jgi:hypothetical protein
MVKVIVRMRRLNLGTASRSLMHIRSSVNGSVKTSRCIGATIGWSHLNDEQEVSDQQTQQLKYKLKYMF